MTQLLASLCVWAALATAATPTHGAIQPFEGRWAVRFGNGVIEWCFVENDGSASVVEKLRDAGAKTEFQDGSLILRYSDDRVERWTPIGQRAVVEHWYPAANYPSGKPVLGIADRTDLNVKDVARAGLDGSEKATAAVRRFVAGLRETGEVRSLIDPRYLTRYGLDKEASMERVATTTLYDVTAIDPQTVLAVVGTDQSEKEVWVLRTTEYQGRTYIVPQNAPDPRTHVFTAWMVRRRL